MKKEHLVVWFGSADGRLLGHDKGLYFYDPSDFNSWDKIYTPYNPIYDVTVFQGRLLYLDRIQVVAHTEGSLFETGRFVVDTAIGFKPRNFINLGDKLFIIGLDDAGNGPGVYRKYQYIGSGKSPVYLHDISSSELNVLIAGDKK